MLTPFGKVQFKSQAQSPPQLEDATLRDFSGGLNLVDNDVAIKSNYAKVLKNMHRDVDGGMSLRWGTKYLYTTTGIVTGNVIEMVYFSDKLVVFTDTGQIMTIDGAGTRVVIWNTAIAAALVGAPGPWSSGLTTIDTTEFKGQMVCVNGVDKPILISATFVVTYLQDIPTGSNVFVPIGRFVTTVADYTVIGGVAATPFEIHISAKGTSGTWAGDPAPNDALSINIGTYAPSAGGDIRGISSFRNTLLVHFAKATVPVELGQYDAAGNHTPKPDDVIADFGIISHRMAVTLNESFIFADEQGVNSVKKNVYSTGFNATSLSEKIVPQYAGDTPFALADRQKSFCVHNKLEQRISYFLWNGSSWSMYTLSYNSAMTKIAWSQVLDWTFTCGCLSGRNRVYFAKGAKIFQYGNNIFSNENYEADEVANFESAWLTATAYVVGTRVTQGGQFYICLVNHTSGVFVDDLAANLWKIYVGLDINFDWELPWSDINIRMKKKQIKYIGMDTEGAGTFTLSCFVDHFYTKPDGTPNPIVTMDFVAGDSPGYGGGDQPYGGGRRAIDERLWGFPLEFKLFKLKISGASHRRVKFSTLTVLYKRGNFHR